MDVGKLASDFLDSSLFDGIVKIVFFAFLLLIWILYDKWKTKKTIEGATKAAVQEISLKFIKEKLDEDQAEVKEKLESNSGAIKTVKAEMLDGFEKTKKETTTKFEKIESRVRDSEKDIAQMSTKIDGITEQISDIKSILSNGNQKVKEHITKEIGRAIDEIRKNV